MKRTSLVMVGLVAVSLGACTATQMGNAVKEGQLVCAVGPTMVAMMSTSGAAILAQGATKLAVDTVCGLINGIAVSPPNFGVAPVVTVALPPTVNIPLKS
jgi:hypothetical protein